jgi:hypothetical protein
LTIGCNARVASPRIDVDREPCHRIASPMSLPHRRPHRRTSSPMRDVPTPDVQADAQSICRIVSQHARVVIDVLPARGARRDALRWM